MRSLTERIRRGFSKPPSYIVARGWHELRHAGERWLYPLRLRMISAGRLARDAGVANVDAFWSHLAARPFVAVKVISPESVTALLRDDVGIILSDADRALAHEVDLLGSGPVALGERIDWQRDYKSGFRWPHAYCRDIEYTNPDRPSDVKFPWEVSRMQWMIPLGQAFMMTGEERYAEEARALIESWIADNPYAGSVNWSCTMDVALRVMTWTWLFHALAGSRAWSHTEFRARFLESLYLHGVFTARHLEKSDVNGNHYTADAAGLVFAGLFFGPVGEAPRWLTLGWSILQDELPKQVFADGVDFEASVPYHRLVQELFLYPALYRMACGLDTPAEYRSRLTAMARFTEGYSRPDGSVPLWGDADDARTLPFRFHPINDHRYLLAIAGLSFDDSDLVSAFSGPRSEIVWLLGPDRASRLPDRAMRDDEIRSVAFPNGGFYVLRNRTDHVFVDCGPLGLANRGGHGHNDLLSFEAALDGVRLIVDCGAYLYTADFDARNLFRSTGLHNTPRLDGQEINRFVRPDYLWSLRNDARHEARAAALDGAEATLVVAHTGYARMTAPVIVERTFRLDHAAHTLTISDRFEGDGEHLVETPLHLEPGVGASLDGERIRLRAADRRFDLTWRDASAWGVVIEPARVSPTYGVALESARIVFARRGSPAPLEIRLRPAAAS